MPEWLGWVFAALGAAGTAVAGAWAWYTKQRDKEEGRVGRPYKQLFGELREQLQKANDGFQKLQDEHAECRENLARCQERDALNGRRLTQLEEEVARQRQRLGGENR
jgi:chromosome segregation ATPase